MEIQEKITHLIEATADAAQCITLGDHLRAAELSGDDAFAAEQRRLARLRALRRALRLTPAGDPRANDY